VADAVPQGHWQITTLVAAVRWDGAAAPFVFEGALDTASFRVYVERVLVPVLRPGDIVVMDNLAPHKGAWVAEAVRRAQAEVWYLPPYSPDLNPIEAMWAKVKAWLRRAAARTTRQLVKAIGQALATITPQDCQGFFAHCGYPATPNCKPL
jgi:transposase